MERVTDKRERLHPFVSGDGWHGLVWEGWEEEFRQLDVWLADHQGLSVVDKPNRSVRRVETPRGQVYVKRIQRLADGRHFWRDVLKRIRWYVRPSRALRVARISQAMLRDGVGCPAPLLSVRRRDAWGVPCDVMVSEGLSDPSVLELIRGAGDSERLWETLELIAADLVRIHGLGYVHGDGMPGNLLWDGRRLSFIDNDRTFRLRRQGLRHGRAKNLIQFCRSLEWELRSIESGDRFMDLYGRLSGSSFQLTSAMRRGIQRQVRRSLLHCAAKEGCEPWFP